MSGQTGEERHNEPKEKEWEVLADMLGSALREQQRQRERDWRCKYCQLDLREVKYLRPHLTGDCLKEPVLSASAKHGASTTPVKLKSWIDTHYHELMMLAMVAELILLAFLVGLEWHR